MGTINDLEVCSRHISNFNKELYRISNQSVLEPDDKLYLDVAKEELEFLKTVFKPEILQIDKSETIFFAKKVKKFTENLIWHYNYFINWAKAQYDRRLDSQAFAARKTRKLAPS